MATVYRDYGVLGFGAAPSNEYEITKRSQVYQATHRGDGKRLPLMNRSFISFSFGGRLIEDFNLIATFGSDRLNRNGYANFEDTTTNYNNLEGQQYWATHYKNNSLDLTLSTDGIDQRQLDDFLYWFRAGDTKELILAEHPNRAILARVAQPPQLDLLPFEQPINTPISDVYYSTSTTLYKGDISLNLVMDDPHWYALTNILGQRDDTHNRYIDQWYDVVTGEWVDIVNSPDALKILYEDGIPMGSMIQQNMLLGNRAYANVLGTDSSKVWSPQEEASEIEYFDETTHTWSEPTEDMVIGMGARVESDEATFPYLLGTIAGAVVEASENGITTLSKRYGENDNSNIGYFYYSGTAPSPTIITFTMHPKLDYDTGYIVNPANSFLKGDDNKPYSSLFIEGINIQELRFTTPNVFTSYNKAIKLFKDHVKSSTMDSWENVRQLVREEIRHAAVREWAIYAIQQCSSTAITASAESIKAEMRKFLLTAAQEEDPGTLTLAPATFTFNSGTGEATGIFCYRKIDSPTTLTENIEENVGDMLQSNYIIIRDRNYPTATGHIVGWSQDNKEYSHRIYHTSNVPLENLSIEYKNMYL